jgi:hypothetical protein
MVNDLTVAKKMLQIKKSADDRNLPFDLSFSETKKLLTAKRCFFTKIELNEIDQHPDKRSFDRIDNSKGYINGNVVACTTAFNQRKGNITIGDIELLYKLFRK